MNAIAEEVCARLDALKIPYDLVCHAPVHTIEDCADVDEALHSLTAKNYFLTTKNQKRFYLCLARPQARFRTADISRQAGSSRLSFGPEDRLWALLRTYPGAVSPFGLMFDEAGAVELLADGALWDADRLSFHPCDNSMTLAMAASDFFERFLPAVGHPPRRVEIHDFME